MVPAHTPPVDVLIVDDQDPFRAVARRLVGRVEGWRVVGEAMTGEDAIAQTSQLQPGVILMDINLPGISGIEATRRIHLRHPDIAVVLVSSYAVEDLPAEASTCGAAAYISKDHLTPARLRGLLGT
jgi:two-component system invasion response regulator UvrY